MSTVQKSIDLDVPVRTAYNQWTQFEEFPQFMEGVDRVEQTAPDKTHWEISIGGVQRAFDAQITEQHPDQRIAWTSTDGVTHAGAVTFQRIGDAQTRLTLQLDAQPEGAVEKLGDALGLVERRCARDLERFKDLIEERDVESGGWRGEITGAHVTDSDAGRQSGALNTALLGPDAPGQPYGSPRW